jgi:DNA (cytosine-5)-methyltransferase 1
MGFPDSYKKNSPKVELYKQIGNSVCVPMISLVANEIKDQFLKE